MTLQNYVAVLKGFGLCIAFVFDYLRKEISFWFVNGWIDGIRYDRIPLDASGGY
jgi:hypothetical protein